MAKQFGLILPNKQGDKRAPPIFTANKNVFGDESDSDDDVKVTNVPVNSGEKLKRQAKALQNKLLGEDPTVYQYDELYDDIDDKRKLSRASVKAEDKKPKYIEKLLHTAEKRKIENERRIERQVQKEREEEGDKFADKEAFVTSSYKKKLEELKLQEEREKREEYLEEIGDVTKQADLGGFYRHLYEQQLRPEKVRPDIHQSLENKKTPEKVEEKVDIKKESSDSENAATTSKIDDAVKKKKEKRTYRKRKSSGDEGKSKDDSNSDDEVNRKAINTMKTAKKAKSQEANIDADSDFSIDDSTSSSDEDNESKEAKDKTDKNQGVKKDKSTLDDTTSKSDEKTKTSLDVKVTEDKIKKDDGVFKKPDDSKQLNKNASEKNVENSKPVVIEEPKPKIDIWKKRTVGDVFDQALQRYYQRKASRGH